MLKWQCLLSEGLLPLLIVVSCQLELSRSQDEFPVQLTINPVSAIIDDIIEFKCTSSPPADAKAVFYYLKRDEEDVVVQQFNCAENKEILSQYKLSTGRLDSPSCQALGVKDVKAERNSLAGAYRCIAHHLLDGFVRKTASSDTIRLTVGDKTPPVSAFSVVDLATGAEIANGSQVPAGTNTTVTCETQPTIPEPAFTVSITGKENRTNLTIGHRVSFHEAVPRQPLVVYTCEVYNGFGERQSRRLTINATYGAIPSEVTVPEDALIQMETDVEICSARNHPSKQLQISDLDPAMVQEGYPIFRQELGVSYAYVRLSNKAAEVKDARLEYTCYVGDMQPVKASVVLFASNTAMMTVGIVIAALVAFLLIVGGIAYYLKKRNASAKPASDKAGYDRVNQNEADQAYNVGGTSGRKGLDSKCDPVCV